MLVLYYFQGEIGESLEQPNAVMVNGEKITLNDFLNVFPFKNAVDQLKFRFRKEDSNYGYVWLDIANRSEGLPVYNGVVTAKILKLDSLSVKNRKVYLKQKLQVVNQTAPLSPVAPQKAVPPPVPPRRQAVPMAENNSNSDPPRTSPVNSSSAKFNKSAKNVPLKEDAPSSAPPASEPHLWADANSKMPAHAQADILNFDDDGFSQPQSRQQTNIADMLDFGAAPSTSAKNKSTKKPAGDFIPTSSSALDIDEGGHSPTGGVLNRAELAQKREEVISEKVQGALEFKKELDEKAQREALEFDSAREKHEKNLLAWATNNKEKRNIRTLLSTMHTVLPKDTKWKSIGLGDVLEPRQVKLQYRKAMLVVHPDHCINADSESKFICKRVFEALNEAWDEFSKKEGL